MVEHLKLNGSTALQLSSHPEGSNTVSQEGRDGEEEEGEGEESILQVKELLKTEREQRVSLGQDVCALRSPRYLCSCWWTPLLSVPAVHCI